jgi:hypothetical protein
VTNSERIEYALELAKAGKFHEAQCLLLLANADDGAWHRFGKYWRGEGR